LGQQFEEPFLLGTTWKDHFDKCIAAAAQAGQGVVSVGDLRRWIDEPEPIGLPRDLQNLLILSYAAQSARVFRQHGGPAQPALDKLEDDLELVSPNLPGEDEWNRARARASSIFGIADVNPTRSSFEALHATLRAHARTLYPPAQAVQGALELRLGELGIDLGSATRYQTSRAARQLVESLTLTEDALTGLEAFANVHLKSEQHVGTALATAEQTRVALTDQRWQLLSVAVTRAAAGEPGFVQVVAALRDAVSADEFAVALEPAIAKAYQDTVALIGTPAAPPAGPVTEPPMPPVPPAAPGVSVARGTKAGLGLDEARTELDRLAAEDGEVEVSIAWTITTRTPDA
ncbi:MAG: hypothetical protein WKF96_24475, partial [Solirubrobacteraceae bacterium]